MTTLNSTLADWLRFVRASALARKAKATSRLIPIVFPRVAIDAAVSFKGIKGLLRGVLPAAVAVDDYLHIGPAIDS